MCSSDHDNEMRSIPDEMNNADDQINNINNNEISQEFSDVPPLDLKLINFTSSLKALNPGNEINISKEIEYVHEPKQDTVELISNAHSELEKILKEVILNMGISKSIRETNKGIVLIGRDTRISSESLSKIVMYFYNNNKFHQ